MPPKVSIVMGVYNGSQFLRESIDSILNQTFTDWEFIIIDDGSTDDTRSILSEYVRKDSRIKLHKNTANIGLTKSLNKGLKLAKGEYIARQDADDVSLPTRFEKQVSFLQKHSETVLVSCDIELIDARGFVTGKHERHCQSNLIPWYLLFYNHIAGHSQVMFKKSPVLSLGGYCQTYRYSQDYQLWCRLSKIGQIAILPEILLQQRFHNGQISSSKSSEQENYALSVVQQNLQSLINEKISLKEIKDIQGFWLGHWWSIKFPSVNKARKIHYRLKQIEAEFTRQNYIKSSSNTPIFNEISEQQSWLIRDRIGQQFLYWLLAPTNKNRNTSIFKNLIISLYALYWHPLGLFDTWLFICKNTFIYCLNTIYKIPQKLSSTLKIIFLN